MSEPEPPAGWQPSGEPNWQAPQQQPQQPQESAQQPGYGQYEQYGYGQPGQPPQWQQPGQPGPPMPPPSKRTPVGLIVAVSSIALVVGVAAAFVGFGPPGLLRNKDQKIADRTEAPTTSTFSAPPPSSVPTGSVTVPGERVPMPKRPTPLADPITCAFTPDTTSPAPKKANLPPNGPAPSSGTVDVTLQTTAGDIGLTLDRALAPCTVVNFLSLANQGFYDGVACHRLSVQAGLQMLQCGDPAGDGSGGPGYTIKDETFPSLTYGRGMLAMATTSEPDSGGSQFFMVYGQTEIPPNYTVFGSIGDAGLQVLDKVARGGVDQSKLSADGTTGPPNIPVRFTHVVAPR